jgi:ABC-type amino acid transport substrate-binding protein
MLSLLLIAGVANAQAGAAKEKKLLFSGIAGEPLHVVGEQILTRAYAQLGIAVSISYLPGKRAMYKANHNVTDGDVARIAGTELEYQHLIKVPTPLFDVEGVAFSKQTGLVITSWQDLKGLKVGIVNGIRFAEIGTQGMAPVKVGDLYSLLHLLDSGRIDVAITTRQSGLQLVSNMFSDRGIHITGNRLFSAPLYHYLHTSHRLLVEDINGILLKMRDSGELKAIYHGYFSKAVKSPSQRRLAW